jgi:hypothetical protein
VDLQKEACTAGTFSCPEKGELAALLFFMETTS